MNSTKSVNVQYYAVFREQRGVSVEQIATGARTVRDLYGELRKAHGFSLPEERVQVAVNDEFVGWDEPIAEGATVVFIPPVAGG